MTKVFRGKGMTESEKHLAKLGDKTFLALWAYPNTFIDKKAATEGKELCDLLVVCGNDVIIFSDKAIDWPSCTDVNLAWSRWYRRAIEDSATQIHGAERWIKNFPGRVFADRKCNCRIPVEFPKPELQNIHGIVVASGAKQACINYFKGGAGTLVINSSIENGAHKDPAAEHFMPFAVGDVSPAKSFVHVFDRVGLDLVMSELDTVADFTRYLNQRREIIRSKNLIVAPGEEELLALYLQTEDINGAHSFLKPDGSKWVLGQSFRVENGFYAALQQRPEYHAKKSADRVSYVWDSLIGVFTDHVLAGTSISLFGVNPDATLAERALRIMALEDRFARRILGSAFLGALDLVEEQKANQACRITFSRDRVSGEKVAYVFFILAYTSDYATDGYGFYRKVRASTLHIYCLNVLDKYKDIHSVVGIAIDGPRSINGAGGSEDLLAVSRECLTEAIVEEARKRRDELGILDPERMIERAFSEQEYPEIKADAQEEPLSRQRRRAEHRKVRKAALRRSAQGRLA
jgi:hypothetical protein